MRQGSRSPPGRLPGRFDRLLHLGNVVVDIVLTVPALPERGGDVLASQALTAGDLDPVRPGARDAVYLSGYSLVHGSNRAALLGWLARLGDGNIVFFDPGPLVGSIPAGALATVLGRADWLTCNAREAAILAGTADP